MKAFANTTPIGPAPASELEDVEGESDVADNVPARSGMGCAHRVHYSSIGCVAVRAGSNACIHSPWTLHFAFEAPAVMCTVRSVLCTHFPYPLDTESDLLFLAYLGLCLGFCLGLCFKLRGSFSSGRRLIVGIIRGGSLRNDSPKLRFRGQYEHDSEVRCKLQT